MYSPTSSPRKPRDARTIGLISCFFLLMLSAAAAFAHKFGGFDHLREFLFMQFLSFAAMLTWGAAVCLILESQLRRFHNVRGLFLLAVVVCLILGALGLAHLAVLAASH